MKATAFEFRFRFLIHTLIYLLGFTAPWDRLLSAETGRTAWLILAAWPAHNHWLSFSTATIMLSKCCLCHCRLFARFHPHRRHPNIQQSLR